MPPEGCDIFNVMVRLQTAEVFGKWSVMDRPSPHRQKVWCQCECGAQKEIWISNLKSGKTKSCGKHEHPWRHIYPKRAKQIPEYRRWSDMKNRCDNQNNSRFQDYGGRGIKVCDRWSGRSSGFINFLEDIGPMPSPQHTIERLDNDGPYSSENCIWSTWLTQARNKRKTVRITHQERTMTAMEWSIETGLSAKTIRWRYRRGERGDVLFSPLHMRKQLKCPS